MTGNTFRRQLTARRDLSRQQEGSRQGLRSRLPREGEQRVILLSVTHSLESPKPNCGLGYLSLSSKCTGVLLASLYDVEIKTERGRVIAWGHTVSKKESL